MRFFGSKKSSVPESTYITENGEPTEKTIKELVTVSRMKDLVIKRDPNSTSAHSIQIYLDYNFPKRSFQFLRIHRQIQPDITAIVTLNGSDLDVEAISAITSALKLKKRFGSEAHAASFNVKSNPRSGEKSFRWDTAKSDETNKTEHTAAHIGSAAEIVREAAGEKLDIDDLYKFVAPQSDAWRHGQSYADTKALSETVSKEILSTMRTTYLTGGKSKVDELLENWNAGYEDKLQSTRSFVTHA